MKNNTNSAELIDISTIKINPALPKEEKILLFIHQTNNNPYHFLCGKYKIISVFDDNAPSLENNFKRFTQTTNSTFLTGDAII